MIAVRLAASFHQSLDDKKSGINLDDCRLFVFHERSPPFYMECFPASLGGVLHIDGFRLALSHLGQEPSSTLIYLVEFSAKSLAGYILPSLRVW